MNNSLERGRAIVSSFGYFAAAIKWANWSWKISCTENMTLMATKIMTFECHIDSNFIESNLRSTRQVSPKSVLTMLLSCILFFISLSYSSKCPADWMCFFFYIASAAVVVIGLIESFSMKISAFFLSVSFTRFSKTLSNVIFKPNCKSSNCRPSIRQCMPGRTENR